MAEYKRRALWDWLSFPCRVTKGGHDINLGQEAICPPAFTDSEGKSLNGNNSHVIHFDPGPPQPPVHGFWSASICVTASYFVNNQITRYLASPCTGPCTVLKDNSDGSPDIYIHNANPGLESGERIQLVTCTRDSFRLSLRLHLPSQTVLVGTWSPPPPAKAGSSA